MTPTRERGTCEKVCLVGIATIAAFYEDTSHGIRQECHVEDGLQSCWSRIA